MDLSQYLTIFFEEAREHLQKISECLLELEKDPCNLETINELFRSAHTLKGMSATMGFTQMAELTHEMESFLQPYRGTQQCISSNGIDLLLKVADTLEIMLEEVASQGSIQTSPQDIINQLRNHQPEAAESVTTKKNEESKPTTSPAPAMVLNEYEVRVVQDASSQGLNVWKIKVILREDCLMKVPRVLMVYRNLEQLGEIIKTVPDTSEIEEDNFDRIVEFLLISSESASAVETAMQSVSELESYHIEAFQLQARPVQETKTEKPAVLSGQETIKPAVESDKKPSGQLKAQTLRVDIQKLDILMNLVGELVINKTRLFAIARKNGLKELNETIEQMDFIFSELQNLVMKVRMVPVETVFNRFPRMVRDLARELGKEIDFQVYGADTELDRTVIDEIGEPLVHLLRNAIDHGIESPAERLAKGKPAAGTISLSAFHEGNHVVIEIKDDGKGIDTEKVVQKALQNGLINSVEAEQMSEEEKLALIFRPGLSTAEKVTDISGRGVGMDAVKKKIESLNGRIMLNSRLHQGTTVHIILPLTLAILQSLLIKIGQETYAVPIGYIEETAAILQRDILELQGAYYIKLREVLVPVYILKELLEHPWEIPEPETELPVVIVRTGRQRIGLIVDELLGQQEIVIKSLGPLLTGISGIAGATILANGEVALILDVPSLLTGR